MANHRSRTIAGCIAKTNRTAAQEYLFHAHVRERIEFMAQEANNPPPPDRRKDEQDVVLVSRARKWATVSDGAFT